jgi:serine/threonine-protein kinase
MHRYIAAKLASSTTSRDTGLSGELTALSEHVPKQLRALAFSLGALFFVGFVLNLLGPSQFGWNEACSRAGVVFDGTLFLASVALFVTLGKPMPARRVVHLGMGYLIGSAFAVSLMEQSMPQVGVLSLVVVFILLAPLFLPTTLKLTFLMTFGAATTGPLATLLYFVLRGEWPASETLVQRYFFSYFMAFLAIIPAKIMYRIGRAMTRARRMGSYELVSRVGRGGMGEVWRAAHRMLRRPAAIKLIRPETLGAATSDKANQLLRRFEREVQATAGLHSAHTIEVYDFGITEEGTFFYVMELLNGHDLETFVEEFGPMPPERVVHVLRQVCDSIEDAHRSGLIHRDIKPANVFLCRYGHEVDFVKVLDFGLVKSSGSLVENETKLTAEGAVAGTPSFMAPELAVGDGGFDVRIDIYAIGCLAYWLLTGDLVFEADSGMKMVLKHVQEDPVPPSQRSELAIPEALDELVLACLAKDPDRRPQTARALAEQLDRVALEQAWTEDRAEHWWQLHSPPRAEAPENEEDESAEPLLLQPTAA